MKAAKANIGHPKTARNQEPIKRLLAKQWKMKLSHENQANRVSSTGNRGKRND